MTAENEQRARELLNQLINDIGDRQGLGDVFDSIDIEVREEIEAEWLSMFAAALDEKDHELMERAANYLCKYCAKGEEVGKPDAGGQYWHSNPFDWRPCDASKLRAAMEAK